MFHNGKKSLFWSFIIFGYLSFTTVREQKIGFNSCECIKFLNIANFHVFHVWAKRILSCNDTTYFLHFFSFCNATFFHSGYVIKPPQPSSAFYRQPAILPAVWVSVNSALTICFGSAIPTLGRLELTPLKIDGSTFNVHFQ